LNGIQENTDLDKTNSEGACDDNATLSNLVDKEYRNNKIDHVIIIIKPETLYNKDSEFDDDVFLNYGIIKDAILQVTKNDSSVSFVFTFKDKLKSEELKKIFKKFERVGINPDTHNSLIQNYTKIDDKQNLETDKFLITLFEQIMAIEPSEKRSGSTVNVKFNNHQFQIIIPYNSTIQQLIIDSLEQIGNANDKPSEYIIKLDNIFLSSRLLVEEFNSPDKIFYLQKKT